MRSTIGRCVSALVAAGLVPLGGTSTAAASSGDMGIRSTIKAHINEIRQCYEAELAHFPRLEGKVRVRFVISADGSVASSEVVESSFGNADLEHCLAEHVRTWQFPRPREGGLVVTYPFVFSWRGFGLTSQADGGTSHQAADSGSLAPTTRGNQHSSSATTSNSDAGMQR